MKSYTDLEQSKKLIELGIDVNTADMFYADIIVNNNHKYILHLLKSYGFKTFSETKTRESKHLSFIPAWSLSALLELIPNWTMDKTDKVKLTCNPYFHRDDNPVDAVFEMVCWLKENKKI